MVIFEVCDVVGNILFNKSVDFKLFIGVGGVIM